jgi:putative membrane protein
MPYSRFEGEELNLRDSLAVDRTLLANERTFPAYLHSEAAPLIAGVSIMHFSRQGWFWTVGVVWLPIGILAGIIGTVRYRRMNQSISTVRYTSKEAAGKRVVDGAG